MRTNKIWASREKTNVTNFLHLKDFKCTIASCCKISYTSSLGLWGRDRLENTAQRSAFVSCILFPYPFSCTDTFPSSRLMDVILPMQDKADSILPLLSTHLLPEGGESTAYSPGKAAPAGRLDREAVFLVCQWLTLFSQPFEHFFYSKRCRLFHIWRKHDSLQPTS